MEYVKGKVKENRSQNDKVKIIEEENKDANCF